MVIARAKKNSPDSPSNNRVLIEMNKEMEKNGRNYDVMTTT